LTIILNIFTSGDLFSLNKEHGTSTKGFSLPTSCGLEATGEKVSLNNFTALSLAMLFSQIPTGNISTEKS